MCLIVVLSRVVPGAPLIVGGNRDERFERPARPMTVLREEPPRTLGGRDLKADGTWLAVNEAGVVAGLTNRPVPGGPDATKRSRGAFPLALTSRSTAAEAVEAFAKETRPDEYNGAWLLVGDRTSLFSVELAGSGEVQVVELPPGVYVQENRAMSAPSNKADHVRGLLAGIESMGQAEAVERLRAVLADHQIPPAEPAAEEPTVEEVTTEAAPAESPVVAEDGTGVSPADGSAAEEEPRKPPPPEVRAACVHIEEFGTRWSGVVVVPSDPTLHPDLRYSDGPPCRRPYIGTRPLWG
jgi:uncharacterized protein with NRDE domain